MILQRYILRALLLNFLFSFTVILALGVVGTTLQGLRTFEGLGVDLVRRMIPIAAGSLSPWVLLLASGASASLSYGRLAAENEINAMRMSGVHAARILAPALLFGLLLSAAGHAAVEYAAPAAHLRRRQLARESLISLLRLPPPGPQRFVIAHYTLSYADYRDGRMERPYVMVFDRHGLRAEHRAVHGTAVLEPGRPPRLVLSRCSSTLYDSKGLKSTEAFSESDLSIPLEIEDPAHEGRRPPELSREELLDFAERAPSPRQRACALTEYHMRHARALAPLVLVLAAVPLGTLVRKASTLAGLGAALPPLLLYFLLYFLFQAMGENERIPPVAAGWAPDVLLLALAAPLLGGVLRK